MEKLHKLHSANCTKLIRFPWIILISSSVCFPTLILRSPFSSVSPFPQTSLPSRGEGNTASLGWTW